ncbi:MULTISPECIES: hypothetical protein [Bombella]|uniref:Uncharacterized protein n=1 Tax=Bombella pollinis TaxID=2967337 RepID=A0ABT3WMJ3_9PROT|nr:MULTISPECIES: hypothetical protein [Bombella]MCT6855049.1 hypothetical protein [Bombella apis]MCX5619489.1 hypothetical protein [Bombella pollinis]MUG89691.1 hypothetical protein [Bombella sp. ESL0385]
MSLLFRRLAFLKTGLALSTALLCSGLPAAYGAACHTSEADHSAFNLAGLKSELMVTALSCHTQDRYNQFITRFLPILTESEKHLDSYFRRTFGSQAQRKHDDYITQLADVQSLGGLKSGTAFCAQRVPMYDEVDALDDSSSDLAHYAEAKDIAQPASYESCTAPSAPHRTRTRRR